jgi:hypothetical protein
VWLRECEKCRYNAIVGDSLADTSPWGNKPVTYIMYIGFEYYYINHDCTAIIMIALLYIFFHGTIDLCTTYMYEIVRFDYAASEAVIIQSD